MWEVPLLTVLFLVAVMVLPNKFISSFKPIKQLKAKMLKQSKKIANLSVQGPFYRFSVWFGKKVGFGKLSSRCQPPTCIKVKPESTTEALVEWKPTLPTLNPFHEEHYICSWQHVTEDFKDEEGEGVAQGFKWRSKEVILGDYEDTGKRFKMVIDGLPPNSRIRVRVGATNKRGRGDWSNITTFRTLVAPRKDGGYYGPLGPAAKDWPEERQKYRWLQQKGSIEVKAPIPDDWKASEIKLNRTQTRLEVVRMPPDGGPPQVLLSGAFKMKVKVDEVFWQIDTSKEEGRHLALDIKKDDVLKQWPSIFSGDEHPAIDPAYVRLLEDGMTENIDWLRESNPH